MGTDYAMLVFGTIRRSMLVQVFKLLIIRFFTVHLSGCWTKYFIIKKSNINIGSIRVRC